MPHKLDLGDKRQVFHSFPQHIIEMMEAAEVPRSIQLIVGQRRTSLAYGHYSKGKRIKLREYINRLRYWEDVMSLIHGFEPVQSNLRQAA